MIKGRLLLLFVIILMFSTCKSTMSAQDEKNNTSKNIPVCIQQKIDDFKKQPIANPPISIYQYNYNRNIVYYITAPCCDRYTTLYDENCNIICHPSGGITGKGDGKCNDFFEKRSNEKIIWKDNRTSK